MAKDVKSSDIQKAMIRSIRKTYFSEIVENTPGSGTVSDGWDMEIRGENVVIFNDEFGDIVLFLEEGTKPHIIKPKNKKALHWGGKTGPVFKVVHHPGTTARKFISKVLESKSVFLEFEKAFEIEIKKLIV